MNVQWQEKMTDLGVLSGVSGAIEADVVSARYIKPLAELNSPVLVDLSALAIIDVIQKREDLDKAAKEELFLPNQVCNDIAALAKGEMQTNGYCSPKGRLLALFTALPIENGWRLILPREVSEAFVKRLQMFRLRAKVEINVRDDLVCSGIVLDAEADTEVLTGFANLPDKPRAQMCFTENANNDSPVQLLRYNDSTSERPQLSRRTRYISIAKPETHFAMWESDAFKKCDWAYWRWLEINAGMPSVFQASTDQFIPQMLNMQHINGLSFSIGCYPGQEIVARMQYLGKLKKHMQHFRVSNNLPVPQPGDVITTASNNNAGQVVDAVADEQGINLLCVVNIETPVEELMLNGEPMQAALLPYSLELEAQSGA